MLHWQLKVTFLGNFPSATAVLLVYFRMWQAVGNTVHTNHQRSSSPVQGLYWDFKLALLSISVPYFCKSDFPSETQEKKTHSFHSFTVHISKLYISADVAHCCIFTPALIQVGSKCSDRHPNQGLEVAFSKPRSPSCWESVVRTWTNCGWAGTIDRGRMSKDSSTDMCQPDQKLP